MPDRIIPEDWLPENARIFRVIIHWTAGAYKVNGLEKYHYHCILQDQEALGIADTRVIPIRGTFSPLDNNSTSDGKYAAHTRGLNSNSYGLCAGCMRGAREGGPYGRYPLTNLLWERLAQAAGDVCAKYHLAVTPRTVLQHGEVQTIYGINQRGKWDCTEQPFSEEKSKLEVCEEFRNKVRWYLKEYHDRHD